MGERRAPEGNPADLPAPPVYPDGWSIGQPDVVLLHYPGLPGPASGTIDYKYFEVPTNFTEDQWIQADQVKPGTPSVVHHVIVYAKAPRPAPVAAPPAGTADAPRPPRPPTVHLRTEHGRTGGGQGGGGASANTLRLPRPRGWHRRLRRRVRARPGGPCLPCRHGDRGAGRCDPRLPDALHRNGTQAADRRPSLRPRRTRRSRSRSPAALVNANFTLPAGAPVRASTPR